MVVLTCEHQHHALSLRVEPFADDPFGATFEAIAEALSVADELHLDMERCGLRRFSQPEWREQRLGLVILNSTLADERLHDQHPTDQIALSAGIRAI